MTVAPVRHVVVVDGSNLATEGRTTPSLRQLDEAIRAYAAEDPDAEIVVVVDASFEHRIDPSERKQLIDAELHGEVVSPPAGAIGRGDAFVLRIAERTGAIVLSNDSFQEFHAEHPWLFDRGRLVGGKPVPGVGWIFTPRIPVRGPKSRQAAGKGKGEHAQALSPPVKAAELAKAAKKVAARKAPVLPDGSIPKVGDVWPAGTALAAGAPEEDGKKKAKKGVAKGISEKGAKAKGEKQTAVVTGGGTTEAPAVAGKKAAEAKPAAAAKKAAPEKRAVAAKKAAPEKEAAREVKAAPAAEVTAAKKAAKKAAVAKGAAPAEKAAVAKRATPAKRAAARGAARKEPAAAAVVTKPTAKGAAGKNAPAKKAAVAKEALAKGAAPAKGAAAKKAATRKAATKEAATRKAALARVAANGAAKAKAARSTAAKNPAVQEAIGQALAEAIAPVAAPAEDGHRGRGDEKRGKQDGKGGRHRRRRSPSPPPAVNEPLAFITFVATYPCDSELEGEVVSFTSHGAMVDVDLPGGGVLHSYIPLTAMGDPPPTKARQVLRRGERRRFVLVALDPPRRVAELALPEVVAGHGSTRR